MDGRNREFKNNRHWDWLRCDWVWEQKRPRVSVGCVPYHTTGVLEHIPKPDCLSPAEETHLVKILCSEDLILEAWTREFEVLCQALDSGWRDSTSTFNRSPAGHHPASLSQKYCRAFRLFSFLCLRQGCRSPGLSVCLSFCLSLSTPPSQDGVPLCSLSCPGTLSVNQPGLELRDPSASAS